MNKRYMVSLLAVIVLFLLAYVGVSAVPATKWLFGVIIPYAAVLIFIVFFVRRILEWARVPIPFKIPTTGGQQKSLPWIKPAKWDTPFSKGGVFMRMLLEVVAFRSLFRNTRMKLRDGRVTYALEIFLWVGALAFHYAFFTVLFRHLRFFTDPVPLPVQLVENVDGFFRLEIVANAFQIRCAGCSIFPGLVLLAAVTYLLLRRLLVPGVKYISLASDYFPLFLIIGIAFTGILMRYFLKIDVAGAKELSIGLVTFRPTIPENLGQHLFCAHVFRQHPAGLLSIQQADALWGGFS